MHSRIFCAKDAVSLSLRAPEVIEAKRDSPQFVGFTVDEATKVLSLIGGKLPVVNVFLSSDERRKRRRQRFEGVPTYRPQFATLDFKR